MPVEAITYISDFNQANPPSGDQVAEGDNHIRDMKRGIQNSLPNASKPFYFPGAVTKTTDYTIVQADQNKLFFLNTTAAAITLTLPTISSDDGWMCKIVKWTADANPVFVVPPSGTIQSGQLTSLTKTRRGIPGIICEIFWTGGVWFIQRAISLPIGSTLPFYTASLPFGFVWCNGQALDADDYPEYAVLSGSTAPDLRGRVPFGNNTMGTAASPARISFTESGITGDVLGSVGGTDSIEILPGNLYASSLLVDVGGTANVTANTVNIGTFGVAGTVDALNKMPPTIILNYGLVVE